jgi:hypothetical protein
MFKVIIKMVEQADMTTLTVVCLNFPKAPKGSATKTVNGFAPQNVFLSTVLVSPDKIISFNLDLACGFVNVLKITEAELLARLLHK